MVDWDPWVLVFLASALASVGAGAVVWRARPARMNRWVAAVLALEGVIFVLTGGVAIAVDAQAFLFLGIAITVLIAWVTVSYLQVVSLLPSRLGRPLGRPIVRGLLVVAAAAVTAVAVLRPSAVIAGLGPGQAWAHQWVPGPVRQLVLAAFVVANLFGLACALRSVRVASRGSAARRKAIGFAKAFGVRDVAFVVLVVLSPVAMRNTRLDLALFVGFSVVNLVFLTLLANTVLREQLFDIQVRVRRGISLGTVLALVAALPLALREAAVAAGRTPASDVLTGAAFVVMAGTVLALRPAIDRALVRTLPVPDLDARRIEVYRSALEEAGDDDASQRMLHTLRKTLGLTDRDHALLASPHAQTPAPGRRFLARFDVLEQIGASSFLADDTELGRRVVLKALPARAEPGARVEHPNVVAVHDLLEGRAQRHVVMEHMAKGCIEGKSFDEASWRRLCTDAWSGLAAIHEAGLVHGDVNPSDILLRADGSAAIAGPTHVRELSDTLERIDEGASRYMSPERARGAGPSQEDDVWALAATLYEARAGRPFSEPGDASRGLGQEMDLPDDIPAELLPAFAAPRSARAMLVPLRAVDRVA